jgi:multidrug efflux pump
MNRLLPFFIWFFLFYFLFYFPLNHISIILSIDLSRRYYRGLVGVFVPLIPGKDINTLEEKTIAVEKIVKDLPEGKGSLTFVGEWGGSVVLPLKPLSQRKRTASEIVNGMEPEMMSFPSVDAWPWSWDSGLPGMDDAMGGSELSMVISTPHSYRDLFDQIEKVRQEVEKANICKSIRHNLRLDVLGYAIDLDNNLLSELNLTQRQVSKMIEIFFSGDQSLTFQKEGLLYAITLQGGINPWTLNELYLTNREGKRISLGAVAKMTPKAQPKSLFHYNQMRSATLTADLRPGEKMETVMPKLLHAVEKTLGPAYKKNWGGAAKGYTESSMTMAILFLLALIFIYAILSIQFESFVDPLIVLCTVPLACAGALLVVWLCGQSMNIYTQVGLITLIGLITKHGILIVEFSNQLVEEGLSLLEAVQKASLLRLRPILMTTGAMIFGSIPLVISQEAGAESRHVIGAVLLGGLGLGTLFTLFILPIVCYGVKKRLGAV